MLGHAALSSAALSSPGEYFAGPGTLSDDILFDMLVIDHGLTLSEIIMLQEENSPVGYGAIQNFQPGEYTFQKAIFGFSITSPVTNDQVGLQDYTVKCDVPDVWDKGSGVSLIADWNSISFTKTFNVPPIDVRITITAGNVDSFYELQNVTTSGFEVRLLDKTDGVTPVTGTISWSALGY